MRRDLLSMVRICYRGGQELGSARVPQLEAVRRLKNIRREANKATCATMKHWS